MLTRRQTLAGICSLAGTCRVGRGDKRTMRICVSDNRRFLQYENGKPYFYLADTAWELFHRLNREEAEFYLSTRAAQGFTVVQAAALAELDGLHTPNPYGDLPLKGNDPKKPNDAYFAHIDYIVNRAEQHGITIAMLPTWGDKWNKKWGVGPEVFTPENALSYGEWIGRRYQANSIIWVLGGDRAPETPGHYAVTRALAQGIRLSVGSSQLISYHSWGGTSSGDYFHSEAWLDFNMCQTGHKRNRENWRSIAADYSRTPVKPCMDAEPGYENIPDDFKGVDLRLQAHHCRKSLYWALLSGAHGHTYGCNDIWQMWTPERKSTIYADTPWQKAVHFPGAGQMQYAKKLLLTKNYFSRVPDQSILISPAYTEGNYISAARFTDGTGAIVYSAAGRAFTVELSKLSGPIHAQWYNPRTGSLSSAGNYSASGSTEFVPPTSGDTEDWALRLSAR